METKITKGEWRAMSQITQGEWIETTFAPQKLVARIHGETFEERCANAKLMASAPELLKALQSVGLWITGKQDGNKISSEQILEIVEKAIQKATA